MITVYTGSSRNVMFKQCVEYEYECAIGCRLGIDEQTFDTKPLIMSAVRHIDVRDVQADPAEKITTGLSGIVTDGCMLQPVTA
jgi:hypothetical protein